MDGVIAFLNLAVRVWALWMVHMTWQVTVVAVVIWFVTSVLRRSSATFRHLLWLLVFVKLVIPPSLATPWSTGTLFTRFAVAAFGPSVPLLDAFAPSVPPLPEGAREQAVSVEKAASSARKGAPPSNPAPGGPAGATAGLSLAGIVMCAWGAVSAGLLGFLFVQWRRYARRFGARLSLAPGEVQDAFARHLKRLGPGAAKRLAKVRVCTSSEVTTPAVFGVFRPRIIIPEDWEKDFSPEELESIVAHEAAHVLRGDLVMAWPVTVLSCLHWFHPVVWLAHACLRREREMACDDLALTMTRQESKRYASAMLHAAEAFRGTVPSGAGFLGLFELSDNLLQRIRSVGDGRRSRRLGAFAGLGIILIAVGLPMGVWPAAAMQNDTQSTAVSHALPAGDAASPAAPPGESTLSQDAAPAPAVTAIAAAPAPLPSAGEGVSAALVEFSRAGGGEGLAEVSVQLHELVTERLANTEGIRLVDRGELDEALEELHLAASGLVEASTAGRVGKLIGARFFITGKVMELGAEWVVTARIVDTQTSELKAVRVTSPEERGLLTLADSVAGEVGGRLASLSAEGTPASSLLDKQLAALCRELEGKPLPRVVVQVPEVHLGAFVPDPAGENAIMSVLTRVGFEVVDVSTFMKRQPGRWWFDIFRGPAQDRNGTQIRVSEGSRSTRDILHDERLERLKENADVLVMGEAFSESAGENHGFTSCRARVEIKALDTKRETIAVAASQHATAADIAEHIAGKQALHDAGAELGLELARQLAHYWESNGG